MYDESPEAPRGDPCDLEVPAQEDRHGGGSVLG